MFRSTLLCCFLGAALLGGCSTPSGPSRAKAPLVRPKETITPVLLPLPAEALPTPKDRRITTEPLPAEAVPHTLPTEPLPPGASSSPYGTDPIPLSEIDAERVTPDLPSSESDALKEPSFYDAGAPHVGHEMTQPQLEKPPLFSFPAPPAVAALEAEIEVSFKGHNYKNASAQLERAIRIQPKNPELWHVLADIRLRERQPGLAEDLAKKSNAMAKNLVPLIQSNWVIIAEARRQRGDLQGASEATAKTW